MVVRDNKIIVIIILFFFVSCNKTKKESINKPIVIDKLSITKNQNREFIKKIKFDNFVYKKENDFNNIKSVLLESPSKMYFTYLRKKTNEKGIIFQNFGIDNFLEYKKPHKEYFPFINQETKQIDFIISYDESTEIPLKISFKKGQYFWFGKNFKWITPTIKIKDTLHDDYQVFNKNSFSNENNQKRITSGAIFEFNKKKYLLFIFSDGIWSIHHLFDITDESNIKYYILNSIYTINEAYGDFNNDAKLDFKQKYFYLRNSIDTTQNKYKIYTIK